MTYPNPAVGEYISRHLLAVRVMLNRREDWHLFRTNHIIWTPTIGFMDRNGSMHHHSPGFLPPPEFLALLRIGRARCLMAWTRNAEAARELSEAAEMGSMLAPEALYWLGAARFLERRETKGMWEAWDRLAASYPDSPWARKMYSRHRPTK